MNGLPNPTTPEDFGPYIVYERLGLGGMATVHRAKKTGIAGFERGVALKRLLSHLAEDAVFVESFIREAKVASLLVHPNIAQIYDFGRIGGVYYIAMEHVDGFDVRRLLRHANRSGEPIPMSVVFSIMVEMCDALDYAHTFLDPETGQPLGIVHRDVSPSNLIVASTGHIKVIDFGIAKASSRQLKTESGRVKGKLGYMSPEAAMGNVMGPVSDMFSVGVVAHELLTARPLFSSKTDFETMLRIREGEIYPPSRRNPQVPPALDGVVLNALSRDPYARIQTGRAMREMLEQVAVMAGIRYSARDVAEYASRVKATEDGGASRMSGPSPVSVSFPQPAMGGNTAQQQRPVAVSAAIVSAASPMAGGFVPEADDGTDVWEDDQPNPTGPPSNLHVSTSTVSLRGTADGAPHAMQSGPPQMPAPMPFGAAQSGQSGQFGMQPAQQSQQFGQQPAQQSQQFGAQPAIAPSGPFAMQPSQQSFMTVPLPIGPTVAPAKKGKFWLLALLVVVLAGAAIAVVLVVKSGGDPAKIATGPGSDASPPAAATLASVHFAIDPADATIEIGGKSGTFTALDLPPGVYSVSIKKPGMKPWSNSVSLTLAVPQNIAVTLEPTDSPIASSGSATPIPTMPATVAPPPPNHHDHKHTAPAVATGHPDPTKPGNAPDVPTTTPPTTLPVDQAPATGSATPPTPPTTPPTPPPVTPPTSHDPPKPPTPPARVPLVAASAVTKLSGEVPVMHTSDSATNADVLVKVCIDDAGHVTSASVKKASSEIAAELQTAMMRWRYKPYAPAGAAASPACFPLSLRLVFTHG